MVLDCVGYAAPAQQHELHHTDQECVCPALSRHQVGIEDLYDLSRDLSHFLSRHPSHDLSRDLSLELSHGMSHDLSDNMSHDMSHELSHDMSHELSHDMSHKLSHDLLMICLMVCLMNCPMCGIVARGNGSCSIGHSLRGG